MFLRKVEKSDSRMNHTFRSGQSKRPVLYIIFQIFLKEIDCFATVPLKVHVNELCYDWLTVYELVLVRL